MLTSRLLLAGLLAVQAAVAWSQSAGQDSGTPAASMSGPVVLRQPTAVGLTEDDTRPRPSREADRSQGRRDGQANDHGAAGRKRSQEEFLQFVQRISGSTELRRFGADAIAEWDAEGLAESNPSVPPDYLVGPGDELLVTLWGAVVGDLRLPVDRTGRVALPRVGPVQVAGVRYADVEAVVRKRVAQVFRNFDLSVSLGRLRGKRVYITGFVDRPGAYVVGSLATVTQALFKAGGPSAAGSLRLIEVRRGGQRVAQFDLYDLLLKGERTADNLLQADDVVHVGPLGPQVALVGSVNNPAVFETRAGETVADILRMAGGFTPVADRSRLAIERLDDRSNARIVELSLPAQASQPLLNGDVLRAFSAVDATLPVERQNKRVRVEGEVGRPGEYVLPPASTVADALRAAGGLTPAAFLFGTEFTRESVRVTQQQNYERALRDLETEFTRAATTQRTSTAEEAAAQSARSNATERLVQRLRAIRPSGRVVLQLAQDAQALPDLALEDGDRLYIPPRATSVGVFGSVFNGGSYLYSETRSVEDYLRLAGGPTKGADAKSTFVVRANGSVISSRQRGGFFKSGELTDVAALPGDTVFVPEEINKTTWVQDAKDWTLILYQFGIGLAAGKAFW